MNSTEITNLTNKELELLFTQRELEAITPEVEAVDWLSGDLEMVFTIEGLEAELTEEEKRSIALQNKIDILKLEIENEAVEKIKSTIDANNILIAQLQTRKDNLKATKAGRSFINFYTGKSQFMTFTAINAAKIDRDINSIKEENKDLLAA